MGQRHTCMDTLTGALAAAMKHPHEPKHHRAPPTVSTFIASTLCLVSSFPSITSSCIYLSFIIPADPLSPHISLSLNPPQTLFSSSIVLDRAIITVAPIYLQPIIFHLLWGDPWPKSLPAVLSPSHRIHPPSFISSSLLLSVSLPLALTFFLSTGFPFHDRLCK